MSDAGLTTHGSAEEEAARLRAENALLRERLAGARSQRLRSVAHWLVLVLGVVLVAASVLGIWARNQISDTDRYVRTVAPLATEPSIQTVVTNAVTRVIADPARTEALATELLPPRAAPLATPIAGALERFVRDKVDGFVRSPDFADLWTGISRRTHDAAVRLLTGEVQGSERGRVEIAGDLLVVRLGPLVGPIDAILQRAGLDTRLVQRNAQGEPQIVLGDASGIQSARGTIRLFEHLATVLPLLALLALAGAILLAPTPRTGVLRAGLALAAGMVLLAATLAVGRTLYLDAVPDRIGQAAARDAFDIVVAYLRDGMRIVLAVGVVVAAGAWIAGPSRAAVGLRGLVRGAGRRAGEAGASTGAFGRLIGTYLRPLEALACAVVALVLVAQDEPTAATVVRLAIIALAAVALLELLAAAARSGAAASGVAS